MEEERWHALVGKLELLVEDYGIKAVKAALLTIETLQHTPQEDAS